MQNEFEQFSAAQISMRYFKKLEKSDKVGIISNHEKKLIKLREEVNKLFFNHHFSKSMIARKKKVSRNFVLVWTQSPTQDFLIDNRGWEKGKRRKCALTPVKLD